MATRLVGGGHKVVGFAKTQESIQTAVKNGIQGANSIEHAISQLKPPRVVWIMVPSGRITKQTIEVTADVLSPGDVIIDGGNSNYKDTILQATELEARDIDFVDCGTSGGVWGLKEGYSLMVGGKQEVVKRLRPIFETLAPAKEKGWGYVGPHGAGHYVKMIHNGIEYGMMEALAEGFSILKSKKEFGFNLAQITTVWQHGSVVRSWLLDLAAEAFKADPTLSDVKPWVADSGEGRWTVFEAIDLDVPAPIITQALLMRLASRDQENFSARVLAALRNQFRGHAVKKDD